MRERTQMIWRTYRTKGKKKGRKGLKGLLLAGILLAGIAGGGSRALARETPDLDGTGSLTGTMLHEGEPVGGGTLTLYQAGEIAEPEGEAGYRYVLTDDFAGSEASLEDLEDASLAGLLAEYAYGQELSGVTIAIGADGVWTAEGLSMGLYLVVQYQPADGYEAISPFLVSLPGYDEASGSWIYDVDAQPKMEPVTAETPVTPEPSDEPEEETPVKKDPQLPQTGQLNWPVPVLALAGLILFAVGSRISRKDREDQEGQTCEA